MLIHEYQAKRILKKYGFTIPAGYVAYTPEEAQDNARYMDADSFVVKAQVHNNSMLRRSPAALKDHPLEGVQVVKTQADIRDYALSILNSNILLNNRNREVKRLLIEEYVLTKDNFLVSFLLDDVNACFTCTVEDKTISVSSKQDFDVFASRNPNLVSFLSKCYELLFLLDITELTFYPVGVCSDDSLVILESRMVFDDYALFRHKDIQALLDYDEEDTLYRTMHDHHISFYPNDGNIALIGTGGGMLLLMQDLLKEAEKAAVFSMDIGEQTTEDTMVFALKHALRSPEVDGFLIVLSTGAFPCDHIVEGLVQLMQETPFGVPVLLYLSGAGSDRAKKLVLDSKLPITLIKSLDQMYTQVSKCF